MVTVATQTVLDPPRSDSPRSTTTVKNLRTLTTWKLTRT